MRKIRSTMACLTFALLSMRSVGQAAPAMADPFAALHFLEGNWTAHGTGQGASGDGSYSFGPELNGHVLARHSRLAHCKGPATFDCEHGDLLYVFAEAPGRPLKAIFFDNEGHVIHYDVSTPDPATAVFLSEIADGGPQFRLMYSLAGEAMTGSFSIRPPGSTEWHAYLSWTGVKTGVKSGAKQ